MADFEKGHVPWNKGKTGVYTEETLKRMSEVRKAKFDVGRAVALYKLGMSLADVGKEVGVSFATVQRRLKPLGIIRGKGDTKRGKKLSPETKRKMSEAKRAWCAEHPEFQVGERNAFYGKKHDPETIEEMKRKLSVLLSGEGNPQWRGGISYRSYAPGFTSYLKGRIKKRDGYKCQLCGAEQDELEFGLCVHHINYDKDNHALENLITLCGSCHGKTHHNREHWQKCLERKVTHADS